jgi:hypothetical protein
MPEIEANPPATQNSQVTPFFLAMLFLVAPTAILVTLAVRGQPFRTPERAYHMAVQEASQPENAPLARSLVSVPTGVPVKVVTWTRGDGAYRGKTKAPDYKDTWVTVVPYLQKFCQDFVKVRGKDPWQLRQRLAQRLGLPPDSDYDTFVELTVDPKDLTTFFRPCSDPSPSVNGCKPMAALKPPEFERELSGTDPKTRQELRTRFWLLNTYYGSYASSRQYPWTSLGYTFDWATNEKGDELIRFGESEFVVAAGAAIRFESASDTMAYCTP